MATARQLTEGKEVCPLCASRTLDPATLRCLCGREFTRQGLDQLRARQPETTTNGR